MKRFFGLAVLIISFLHVLSVNLSAQSGGPLIREQASYDVKYYNLDLRINPADKKIGGSLLCTAEITDTIGIFLLDLDNPFTVDSVLFRKNDGFFSSATFNHINGKVIVTMPSAVIAGDMVSVKVFYNGIPRISTFPPWSPGFVWKTTPSGKPWIGVACEDEGADVWWPCKDHPSDEPDSMHMSYTVPNPLMCISNGKFLGSTDNGDNTSTYHWFISTPINNYNVTIYAAEYSLIDDQYISVSGDSIPFKFWVLPESYNTAVNYMGVFRSEFNILEQINGPFPFGTDKHGWAHAPYWGMEHQTIIAYGHNFTLNNWGYDYIHYHELAHEWWGNLITAKDWSDVWIHEGIATYTEALFVETTRGQTFYHQFMNMHRPGNNHSHPLAPRESLTAGEAFDFLNSYSRGAFVMHTLRFHLGDAAFLNLLKRWAYPDSTDYNNVNGRLCRIMSTEDMKDQAESVTGRELDPFFEVFFRQASYPKLRVSRGTGEAVFTWTNTGNTLLDLDVEISVNGVKQLVEIVDGTGTAAISINDNLVIDPQGWILMAPATIVTGVNDGSFNMDFHLDQNYPNPFNPSTTITFSIPENQYVQLKVYDSLGNEVAKLVNENRPAGLYSVNFDAANLSSGIYFYELKTDKFRKSNKMLLLR